MRPYSFPAKNFPEWEIPFLVYKGGIKDVAAQSLLGGGHVFSGVTIRTAPYVKIYSSPILDAAGGGYSYVSPFTSALLNPRSISGTAI